MLQLAVRLYVGVVRADVHELGDIPARLADSVALEPLADLIEQHDGYGLGVVPAPLVKRQRDRAHGGHGHQEVFVRDLPARYALSGLYKYVIAYDKVWNHVANKARPAGDRDKVQCHQKHGGRQYPQ